MLQNKGIEIIKAEATWCGGCKVIAPIIRNLEEKYDVKVKSVDVEQNRDFAIETLKVKNLPTMIVYLDGEEVERLTGRKTKEEYEDLFRSLQDLVGVVN